MDHPLTAIAMDIPASVLAMGKLALIFAVLILLLRRRVSLWLTIFAGALVAALSSGVSPAVWPDIFLGVLAQPDFLLICAMVFLILVLSGVQEASGQSRRLVEGLERYIRSPRIRLVIFPALIGLLPMPGGALFSCPMIRDAARSMNLSDEKKALVNYWFRHIWELAWPLYPGYALACSLLGVSVTTLWRFTFPMVIVAFAVGWFFLLRDLDRSLLSRSAAPARDGQDAHGPPGGHDEQAQQEPKPQRKQDEPLGRVLLHGLPIGLTLAGAAVFSALFDAFLPQVPGQCAFCLSLLLAIAAALWQGRGGGKIPLARLAFGRNTRRILLLLLAIYVFKDTIARGGIVADLSALGDSPLMVLLTCLVVPFVSGLLTGILVGLVGLSFPILLAVLAHSSLQDYTAPLAVLGLIAGNCGQLLSPLHVCLVVTCEFFTTRLTGMLRTLLFPVLCSFSCGVIWTCLLAFLGARF